MKKLHCADTSPRIDSLKESDMAPEHVQSLKEPQLDAEIAKRLGIDDPDWSPSTSMTDAMESLSIAGVPYWEIHNGWRTATDGSLLDWTTCRLVDCGVEVEEVTDPPELAVSRALLRLLTCSTSNQPSHCESSCTPDPAPRSAASLDRGR